MNGGTSPRDVRVRAPRPVRPRDSDRRPAAPDRATSGCPEPRPDRRCEAASGPYAPGVSSLGGSGSSRGPVAAVRIPGSQPTAYGPQADPSATGGYGAGPSLRLLGLGPAAVLRPAGEGCSATRLGAAGLGQQGYGQPGYGQRQGSASPTRSPNWPSRVTRGRGTAQPGCRAAGLGQPGTGGSRGRGNPGTGGEAVQGSRGRAVAGAPPKKARREGTLGGVALLLVVVVAVLVLTLGSGGRVSGSSSRTVAIPNANPTSITDTIGLAGSAP